VEDCQENIEKLTNLITSKQKTPPSRFALFSKSLETLQKEKEQQEQQEQQLREKKTSCEQEIKNIKAAAAAIMQKYQEWEEEQERLKTQLSVQSKKSAFDKMFKEAVNYFSQRKEVAEPAHN
jgi:hypothetical protein